MQKASSWATVWPPVGLATLAALARKKGDVRLVDGNVEDMSLQGLLMDIEQCAPDLVVINSGFPSIDMDMAVAQRIREVCPAAKVLSYGVYFTLLGEAGFQEYPQLDAAIVGEPEETFRELLDVLEAGEDSCQKVEGIIYRNVSGVVVTPPRRLMEDLDGLPFPDRSLLKTERYRLPHNNEPFTLINSARGCPHKCIYCIVSPYYGRKVRRHSIEYVIAELRECVTRYGIRHFLFWEEVFTLSRDHVLALCDAIRQQEFSIHWAATTRVDHLDEEIVTAMRRAGCYLLGLGLESGDQAILDRARKGITLADARNAVRLCKKAGIQTLGHFIFGLPGETRDTANRSIRFMLELGLDYMQTYCAVPYPKTELGECARRNGWIRATTWSAYDFGGESILRTDTMAPEEVSHFRRKAFRAFYFRPSSIFRLVRQIGVLRLMRALAFLRWIYPGKRRVRV